ncbi:MAG: Hsp20/alpha crystallin family protein [Acidobacteria bacterium]|nr:Hsp20/alpha crystallin family protein [Acidobacteriota bacterium]MBI3654831.1 Hsp20/alpha crystallin family protein [Acidobacteriota bacterium]
MKKPKTKPAAPADDPDSGMGPGPIFAGLRACLNRLSEMADKGQNEWTRAGEFGDEQKGVKGTYGFSVRLMEADGPPVVENCGNIRADATHGTVIESAREPLVDVFNENDHVLVIAELPRVEEKDIAYELYDRTRLRIAAVRQDRRYSKEVELPVPVILSKACASYQNGIFELRLPKAAC